jgi:hypothetical protein
MVMSTITLDAAFRSKLNGLNEQLELCDENGMTVGHFLPADIYHNFIYRLAESQCPYTPDQLQAMQQETGGQPLTTLWQSLGQA